MSLSLDHQFLFKFKNLPKQWLLRQQLFDVEFPQFPLLYVHITADEQRIYGFPVFITPTNTRADATDAEILFLTNVDLKNNPILQKAVQTELENRLGIANKVTIDDIATFCSKPEAQKYREFLLALWKKSNRPFGNDLQYGRMYEEIESIVRFVGAWQPKTGRQSEIRMKYNFFSAFGETVLVTGDWDFLDFYLLPTTQDIKKKNFDDFPKFKVLFSAMNKLWNKYYSKTIITPRAFSYKSMHCAWELNKESFIKNVSEKMLLIDGDDRFTLDEKAEAERLVDAFNRHSWRAAFFIWSIMTLSETGFETWTKERFIDFYFMENGKGISPKVVACFLQQGFGNEEVIPIDTWVEAFHQHALGIEDRMEFIKMFQKIGKLKRLIWLVSQANKINLKPFFFTLWCTRFGTRGNKALRGANPISCYECELNTCCQGYKKIEDLKVFVVEETETKFKEIRNNRNKITLRGSNKLSGDESFICLVSEGRPTKVYKARDDYWELVDEHSAYILRAHQKTSLVGKSPAVKEFINSLPPMDFGVIPEAVSIET